MIKKKQPPNLRIFCPPSLPPRRPRNNDNNNGKKNATKRHLSVQIGRWKWLFSCKFKRSNVTRPGRRPRNNDKKNAT